MLSACPPKLSFLQCAVFQKAQCALIKLMQCAIFIEFHLSGDSLEKLFCCLICVFTWIISQGRVVLRGTARFITMETKNRKYAESFAFIRVAESCSLTCSPSGHGRRIPGRIRPTGDKALQGISRISILNAARMDVNRERRALRLKHEPRKTLICF